MDISKKALCFCTLGIKGLEKRSSLPQAHYDCWCLILSTYEGALPCIGHDPHDMEVIIFSVEIIPWLLRRIGIGNSRLSNKERTPFPILLFGLIERKFELCTTPKHKLWVGIKLFC